MSITSGIMQSVLQDETMGSGHMSIMVSTGNEPIVYNRHATAYDLSQVILDYDNIYKFAVHRPARDIYESDYKLHRRSINSISAPWITQEWRDTVERAATESLDEFIDRRWLPWMDGMSPWDYWCDESVDKIDFATIEEQWPSLLDRLGLPQTELKKINGS